MTSDQPPYTLTGKKREVVKGLMKKKYEMVELKRSNIFSKACNLSEWIYNFDTRNFFMFYGTVMVKFRVKPQLTTFQQLVL